MEGFRWPADRTGTAVAIFVAVVVVLMALVANPGDGTTGESSGDPGRKAACEREWEADRQSRAEWQSQFPDGEYVPESDFVERREEAIEACIQSP